MTGATLYINDEGRAPAPPTEALDVAVRAALDTGPLSGPVPEHVEVSITLVTADRMRALNREYHDTDAETDVLSFPLGDEARLLGDVYVCTSVAHATAHELGLPPDEEVLRLVIHGVLHLLGHDHPLGDDRYESPMFVLQERLVGETRAGLERSQNPTAPPGVRHTRP